MKNIILIVLVILVFVGGILTGYSLLKPTPAREQVTSQTILQSLQSRGFLVTETVLADQKVVIENNSGTLWKDLIWGQKITATAIMKTNLGVDLSKLTEKDVKLKGNVATVTLPKVEMQSVELASDINLDNSQGVLKRIFNNDDGYNLALEKLREQAIASSMSIENQNLAMKNAQAEIQRLVKFLVPELEIVFE